MAGEATNEFGAVYWPRHGLFKIPRLCKFAAGGEVESSQRAKVRDAALVVISIVLVDERLADMSIAKCPGQQRGIAARTIRDFIDALAVRRRDLVLDPGHFKSQRVVPRQNVRVGCE